MKSELRDVDEAGARQLVERLVLVLQASLLAPHSPAVVADAFLVSRLGEDSGRAFRTLPRGVDVGAVLERRRRGRHPDAAP